MLHRERPLPGTRLWSSDGAHPCLGYKPERTVTLFLILLPLCLQSDPCNVPLRAVIPGPTCSWLQAKEALFTTTLCPLSPHSHPVNPRLNARRRRGRGSRVRGSQALVSLGDLAAPLSLVPSLRLGIPHLLPESHLAGKTPHPGTWRLMGGG